MKPDKPNIELVIPKGPSTENLHTVEIESPHDPVIKTEGDSKVAVFALKTKNKEEANNVTGYFSAAYRDKRGLTNGEVYGNSNSTIITNYPTDFPYTFQIPKDADTFYIFLRLTLTNNINQPQIPFQAMYRKCRSTGEKLTRLYTGTKEYKEVIERGFPGGP